MSFAENLKNIMKSKKMTADYIAKQIGVSRGTVTHWTNGIRFPKDDVTIKQLSGVIGISVGELFGDKIKQSIEKFAPIVGKASCGVPTTYYSYDECEPMPVPNGYSDKSFYVIADGDSMEDEIRDGMLCLCDPEMPIENKNLVLFTWDGESGIKRYIKQGETIILQPVNTKYDPIVVTDAYELIMVRVAFSINKH